MVGYGVTEERSKSTWWRAQIQAHTSRLLGMVESLKAVGHSPGGQRSERGCQRRRTPCLSVYGLDPIMDPSSTLTIIVALARAGGGREGETSGAASLLHERPRSSLTYMYRQPGSVEQAPFGQSAHQAESHVPLKKS